MEEEHYFYGKPIYRSREQEYIQELLSKYRKEPVTEELKQKIWEELQLAKHEGRITIPYKIDIRQDPSKNFPDYIEVVLDTRV